MPIATLDITPELLTGICIALTEGDDVRQFKVKENGLPKDVQFIRATLVGPHDEIMPEGVNRIRMFLESASFTEGEQLPNVIMETVKL